ncbi:MAG: hypothetical protein COV72_04745 [Candidatus Omnitrophica bacterium CG11_big_fil_rev_8_21_14_0_20_42_13]|uniref:Rubrerythrin diiron-binding domain-containing protein n=1 Tax=Candidatus Ghiorseimicrobium undicola TaxID=1974746 RepID=A0A2H0LXJ5_9BACT|nr:MAG: hypothetical protein COV72_04745 [Candidatus Omnitrophica bacterium CG11_big_fil_rev_8_21_14_0_20_42_13]
MADMLSAGEIIEIAIQIEKNGRDFYLELETNTKDIKAKEVFKFLAEEEKGHISAFKSILDSVEKNEPKGLFSEEYFAYMNALASGHVFTQKDKGREIAKKINSFLEAVDMSIGFEKDSIIFYEGVKKFIYEHDKKVVDEIIKQEQAHFKKLSEVKNYLLAHPEE